MSHAYQDKKHGDEDNSFTVTRDENGALRGVSAHQGHSQGYEGPLGTKAEVGGPSLDGHVGTWVDKNGVVHRGFHAGIKIGKEVGGHGEESQGIPISLGRRDKDHDGHDEYTVGVKMPVAPGVEIDAEYSTETPGSDYTSSTLLGPMGVPLNWGMHMLGLGDYSPGTLLHNLSSSDPAASPEQMAEMNRSAQGRYDTQVKTGLASPQDAERNAGRRQSGVVGEARGRPFVDRDLRWAAQERHGPGRTPSGSSRPPTHRGGDRPRA